MKDAHNSKQMLEILSRLLHEFMMDLSFPPLRTAGYSLCNDCNVSV